MTVAPGTNILRYSGTLDQPIWIKSATYVEKINSSDSPTFRCYRFGVTTTEVNAYIAEEGLPEFQVATVYTASCWFRNENWPTGPGLVLWLRSGVGTVSGILAEFDPTNPSAGVVLSYQTDPGRVPWALASGGIETLPNGWFRVWVSGTSPGVQVESMGLVLNGAGGSPAVGTSMLLGGFTLFVGTNTTYVDTTTAPNAGQYYSTFLFPKHRVTTRYQLNSDQVQFGNGWVFTSKPISPPQRQFTLTFEGLRWVYTDAGQLDVYTNADVNAGALDTFYRQVQLGSRFYYPHDIYGKLVCRFFKPLELPETIKGSRFNVLAPTTVELLEMPQ